MMEGYFRESQRKRAGTPIYDDDDDDEFDLELELEKYILRKII